MAAFHSARLAAFDRPLTIARHVDNLASLLFGAAHIRLSRGKTGKLGDCPLEPPSAALDARKSNPTLGALRERNARLATNLEA
jgi:hypothetical protein